MKRRGATAVEFALLAPAMLAFLFGSLEYGYYSMRQAALEHAVSRAARVGAGTAMADDPSASFSTALEGEVGTSGFNLSSASTDVEVTGDADERFLQGTVSCPAQSLTGLLPHPGTLTVSVHVRLEDQEPVDADS